MHHKALIIDAVLILDALFGNNEANAFLHAVHRQRLAIWVPSLWLVEVAMILQWYEERERINSHAREEMLNALYKIPDRVVPIDPELAKDAARHAARTVCRTVSDGVYLALAQRYDIPFWTSDGQLADNARKYLPEGLVYSVHQDFQGPFFPTELGRHPNRTE